MTVKNYYYASYNSLSDLCNIRERIFHNNKNHYNFSKYFSRISAEEFRKMYDAREDEEQYNFNYILVFETASKLKELVVDNLTAEEKAKNEKFLEKYCK